MTLQPGQPIGIIPRFSQAFQSLGLIVLLLTACGGTEDSQPQPVETAAGQDANPTETPPEGPISNQDPEPTQASGLERINTTQFLSVTVPGRDEVKEAKKQTGLTPESIPGSEVQSYECTTTGWAESRVEDLVDRVAIDQSSEVLYPGGLLQGADLPGGHFTPITIPRAGGTLFLTGLRLAPDTQYTRTIEEISPSSVHQAIQDILSADVEGTAAEASFSVEQIYSYEHLLFSLGIDARYGSFSMASDLRIDTTTKKNHIMMKFTQKYYDVNFETPEQATSVFRDGDSFEDPENQIDVENPPMYVSRVSFGRQVFFVMESEYNASDVSAALEGAYRGLAGSVEVDSNLSYQDVMARTKVRYYVRGGNAGLALKAIDATTPIKMYDAIKKFLADPEAANYSSKSPGAPIAYSVNYLKDRSVVRLSYSVAYDETDCRLTRAVKKPTRFAFQILDNDDRLVVHASGRLIFERSYSLEPVTRNLAGTLSGGRGELKIELYNNGCFGSKLRFRLLRNGVVVRAKNFTPPTARLCGQQVRYRYTLDENTGEWQILEESEWNGA